MNIQSQDVAGETILLSDLSDGVLRLTLNRPKARNALSEAMLAALQESLDAARTNADVRVIILEGKGDAFCGGFDFSGGLEHYGNIKEQDYDPGMDVLGVTNQYTSYINSFMGLWRGAGQGAVLCLFNLSPKDCVVTLSQPLSLNRRSWGQQQQQQLAAPQLVPPSMPFTARPSTAPLTALLPYLLVCSSGRKLNVPVFRLLLVSLRC